MPQTLSSSVDRSGLSDVATTLENMDVLSASIEHFNTNLRGGLPADGVAVPKPSDPGPTPFFPVRAGFVRILRLRVVDCFGQYVDLAGSGPETVADGSRILIAQPMQVPDRSDIAALPPRFTSPARLWLRLMEGRSGDKEAGADVSPICGYLLPDHLDSGIEFFAADASNRGTLRSTDEGDVVWEEAPGLPSTLGQDPVRVIDNPFLAGIASGILAWGRADRNATAARESALTGFLRIVDSTLWTIDPYSRTGDEHLGLLIGHAIAVLRARLLLEVNEPYTPNEVAIVRVPVRLGSLAHWQDGLFGFFLNDDYQILYCTDAAAAGMAREIGPQTGFLQSITKTSGFYANFATDIDAGGDGSTPVLHPYVDTSGAVWVLPNQEVNLTLLVEPNSLVHATAGLLPRKEVGLRREWTADALKKLAPTFRFGPVLADPKRIRMPVAGEAQGSWSWSHRIDVTRWADDPVINSASDTNLPRDPVRASEGWLKLTPQQQDDSKK